MTGTGYEQTFSGPPKRDRSTPESGRPSLIGRARPNYVDLTAARSTATRAPARGRAG